ncbi:MAG: DHH family phosphoesterase [Candidatus Bathyarchaeia archaeon]
MDFDAFRKNALTAISKLKRSPARDVLLIHHDDADGLCSAAIVKAAVEREGYDVKTLCLEKVYPEVIKSLHEAEGGIMIYADIGSSHADFISECNRGRNLTIILDHHDPTPAEGPRIYDLNLEHFGFRGETDFSGATCCYLFSELLDERNRDLSYLAVVGSCEIPGELTGLNRMVLEDASRNKIVQLKGKRIRIAKLETYAKSLFSKLQILGAVGYYEGGPEIAVKTCLEGLTKETDEKVKELEGRRKSVNRRLLARLYRERLRETEHIQWFDAADMYKGMGSKVIGQFCSYLSYQRRLIKPQKYILGMMNLENEIPGWGRLKSELAKVSLRVPSGLKPLIDRKRTLSAVDLLIKASEGFGIADGHEYAANVVLPRDKKLRLVENGESVISSFISKVPT